jgi:hypothetical protein
MKKIIQYFILFLALSHNLQAQNQANNNMSASKKSLLKNYNEVIGKWVVVNYNGKNLSINEQENEVWNFFDYTENGALSIIDEYGAEKLIKGTGTLYGKLHNQNMQGIWHYENGEVFIVYSTKMLKLFGGNYEFKGSIYKEQSFLILEGDLCTNMGDGCKHNTKFKLKLKKT